jgi:hypothetical protein
MPVVVRIVATAAIAVVAALSAAGPAMADMKPIGNPLPEGDRCLEVQAPSAQWNGGDPTVDPGYAKVQNCISAE